jgi:hypothetical protein
VRRALGLPVYRRLLAAYGLNELAWSVGTLALAVLVYRRTGSALGSTGFFLCAQVLPAFAAPVLVAHLDRVPFRLTLPGLYALEAVIFGVLAWMTGRFSLAPVLVLALADGIVAVVARALARTAATAELLPAGLLPEGNALANGVFSICFMAGPAIGGAVVVTGGTIAALLANCGLFAAAAVILATAGLTGPSSDERDTTGGRLRSAIRHVWSARPLRTLISLQALGVVFFTISIPVEVVFAQRTLHAGAAGYGALVSFWGAGAVAGSAVYARWRRRSARTLIAASAATLGAGFAVMAAAPTIAVAVLGAALGGASNGVEIVAVRTALQERTDERWMAIVVSLNEAIAQATPGVGILLGGAIAALASARVALAVAAAGSLGFTVLAWVALRPSQLGPPKQAAPATAPSTASPSKGAQHPTPSHETLVP